jgi:hypothetical protein
MSTIRGTFWDGKVVFATPPEWPEGKEVLVVDPVPPVRMMTEDEQGDDPESIARWLQWFDPLEPLRMTEGDDAAMNAWREAMRDYKFRL